MPLSDLNLNWRYETLDDNVVNDFYVPCLAKCSTVEVVTGFFSGMSFKLLAAGFCPMIDKNNGRIRLIISVQLNEDEKKAIESGYSLREKVSQNLLSKWSDPIDEFEKDYLSLLSYLIASGILDIKVGIVDSAHNAMLHEKISIFTDDCSNIVVASSSGNFTPYGLIFNKETFDVYCSWRGSDPMLRCVGQRMAFSRKWDDREIGMRVVPFPEAVREKIFKYKDYLPKEQLKSLDQKFIEQRTIERLSSSKTISSGAIKFHHYQEAAIDAWQAHGYRGYFDMATGTGKTFTALGAIAKLINAKDGPSNAYFLLIVVPSTELVEQWYSNCKKFGIDAIRCYKNSNNWLPKFRRGADVITYGLSKLEAFIITNNSLMVEGVQDILESVKEKTIIVVDEAHNIGSQKASRILKIDFKFRLGLSATIRRHHDEIGTDKILEFFGDPCIHLSIKEAISKGYLCHYRYYPVLVPLTEEELEEYLDYTRKIVKYATYSDPDDNPHYKSLLIKRAVLVSGAQNKIDVLDSLIEPYNDSFYNLVYCGSAVYKNRSGIENKRQIDDVLKMLKEKHHMLAMPFTAEQNSAERKTLIESFTKCDFNALVAIKCLDEGVDIPCIRTAFILASTTNPKEYIQRRGRLLRNSLSTGKKYAEIYDFVTITRPLSELAFLENEELRLEKGLAKRELQRVEEFANEADNPSDSQSLRFQLMEAYRLDEDNIWEESDDDGFRQ